MFWKRKRPTIQVETDSQPAPADVEPDFVCSHCGRSDLRAAGDWDPPICLECDAAINEDALIMDEDTDDER